MKKFFFSILLPTFLYAMEKEIDFKPVAYTDQESTYKSIIKKQQKEAENKQYENYTRCLKLCNEMQIKMGIQEKEYNKHEASNILVDADQLTVVMDEIIARKPVLVSDLKLLAFGVHRKRMVEMAEDLRTKNNAINQEKLCCNLI